MFNISYRVYVHIISHKKMFYWHYKNSILSLYQFHFLKLTYGNLSMLQFKNIWNCNINWSNVLFNNFIVLSWIYSVFLFSFEKQNYEQIFLWLLHYNSIKQKCLLHTSLDHWSSINHNIPNMVIKSWQS